MQRPKTWAVWKPLMYSNLTENQALSTSSLCLDMNLLIITSGILQTLQYNYFDPDPVIHF